MKKEQKDDIRAAFATIAEAVISAIGNAKSEPLDYDAATTAAHKLIQRTVFQTSETWEGTGDDLGRLVLASPSATEEEKELFRAGNWIGRRLKALSRRFPDYYILHRKHSCNLWKLRAVKE